MSAGTATIRLVTWLLVAALISPLTHGVSTCCAAMSGAQTTTAIQAGDGAPCCCCCEPGADENAPSCCGGETDGSAQPDNDEERDSDGCPCGCDGTCDCTSSCAKPVFARTGGAETPAPNHIERLFVAPAAIPAHESANDLLRPPQA